MDPEVLDTIHISSPNFLKILQNSFDTLFNNAIQVNEKFIHYENELDPLPATLRFRIYNDISDQVSLFIDSSYFICIYSSIGGMLFACQNYFNHFDEILEKQKAGKHQGVRLITSIRNRNDLKLVKTLMEKGIAIRHIIDRPPFDFAISNNYFTSTIENIADGKLIIDNMLTNDDQANLKFYGRIFEKQWESGIDSEERIKEI